MSAPTVTSLGRRADKSGVQKRQSLSLRGTPVLGYALLVFLLAAAMVGAIAVTLTRSARSTKWQESTTALAGGARVAAAGFGSLRADLRADASRLAASLPLQTAVVARDEPALRRIAAARHAWIESHGRAIGDLPPSPRIVSTASIADAGRVLATVAIALPLGDDLLTVLRARTPLPPHAALLLIRNGRVVAGGPRGEPAAIEHGRLAFGKTRFAAQSAPLGVAGTSIVALEPAAAIDALSAGYRRAVLLAALLTLVLAAALAVRLARPVARVVRDLARLSRQAQTDSLTGLANRRRLAERLEDELARAGRNGTSLAFVIADVDDFKRINDGFGHQVGDEVIRQVARALEDTVRELDLVARYGGEEFVLVLPGAQAAAAQGTAERARAAIAALAVETPGGERLEVTASFGVAAFPTYGGADALLAAADAALYRAKRSGKNRVATATVEEQSGGTPGLEAVSATA